MAISSYWVAISLCAVSMQGHYSCARKLVMINIIRCAWNKHCITYRLQEVFNVLDSTILVMCTNILHFQLDLGTLSSEREYVLVLFDPGLSVSAMKRLPCNIIKHNLW